jgi:hypothetical protein
LVILLDTSRSSSILRRRRNSIFPHVLLLIDYNILGVVVIFERFLRLQVCSARRSALGIILTFMETFRPERTVEDWLWLITFDVDLIRNGDWHAAKAALFFLTQRKYEIAGTVELFLN